MRKISSSQLKELRDSGATVRVKQRPPEKKAPPPPPPPKADNFQEALSKQAAATASLAATVGQGQMRFMEQLAAILKAKPEVAPYKLVVNRDRDGFIESIDVVPGVA